MKKSPLFPTETSLCAAFLSALPEGWTPYAETGGWDVVLVRGADGFQVGVQAKLRMGEDVLNQAIEEHGRGGTWRGPDCRAVLVPNSRGFAKIAAALGVTVIVVEQFHWAPHSKKPPRWQFHPALPKLKADYKPHDGDTWHEWCPTARVKLPRYVPDIPAGASAPVQLTEWKIDALRLLALLEARGRVTRHDFKHLGIDHRRWVDPFPGWLAPDGKGGYVAGKLPPFARQHPKVYVQVKADFDEWAPKAGAAGELPL